MKRLLLVGLTAFAASCGASEPDGTTAAACSSNSECGGDLVCQVGVCSVEQSNPRELGFRVVPPPTSTYPTQLFPIRELAAGKAVQIGLDPGVRVAGEITWIGSEAGPGMGQLKFRRQGDDFALETSVQANAYEAFVPAGNYDVTFIPSNTERPTHVWRDVMVELDTDPRLQLSNDLVRVVGTVARTDAISRDAAFVPNARVFATAQDSGITSSISVTDDSGNFELVVPQDSGTYNLHIAPAEPNAYEGGDATSYVPEATYDAAFEVDGSEWANLIDSQGSDVLAVSLGEYSYIPVTIPISLTYDGEDIDWSGTTVTLRTTAGQGVVSVRHRLGAEGAFQLPLISGIYEASVRTPATLPVESTRLEGISVSPEGVEIALGSRNNAVGRVLRPDGAPLEAELRFVPESDDIAQQVSVRTDENGEFSAWLDEETYRLTVVPADPALPRQVLTVNAGEVPEEIQLAAPAVVWGSVFGTPSAASQDWVGLSDVAVHVLERRDGQERVIGEGQTNEDGDFKVVIGAR